MKNLILRISLACGVSLGLAACNPVAEEPPSDRELIEHFASNKEAYELVKHRLADLGVVHAQRHDNGRNQEWLFRPDVQGDDRKSVISSLELINEFSRVTFYDSLSEGQFRFPIYRYGLVTGGETKGIAYINEPSAVDIREALDDLWTDDVRPQSMRMYYMPMDGNWYLYYYYDD